MYIVKGDIRRRTFYLIRVCSARIVRIDLLRCRTLIETNEALKEVLAS